METLERVIKLLRDFNGDSEQMDNAGRETLLADDLGLNSLDVVELIMACEEEFGLDIPDEDLLTKDNQLRDGLETIGGFADYIDRRVAEA